MGHYCSTPNGQLFLGDCIEEMKLIEPGSVDLILTDPPYGTIKGIGGGAVTHGMKGRAGWDTALPTLEFFEAANQILRKNGKMVLFAQQPFTTDLIKSALPNLPFSYDLVWEKNHFANALIAKKAHVKYHEDILVFSKLNPVHDSEFIHPLRPYFEKIFNYIGHTKTRIIKDVGQGADHVFRFNSSQFSLCTEQTYNALIEAYRIDFFEGFEGFEELKAADAPFRASLNAGASEVNPSVFNLWEGEKFKSSILKYKKDSTGFHVTQKPILLLEDLIKTFSNPGNLVADFTCGSGSTGVACENTNRKYILIDNGFCDRDGPYLHMPWVEVARQRITNI